jgi:hypothetical protein
VAVLATLQALTAQQELPAKAMLAVTIQLT